jgi:FlaA1/EpsC-like NDP-sugar epimerase
MDSASGQFARQPTGVENFYAGQVVFFTGATGMVGSAYISTLVLSTPVSKVYALVRGGES